MERRAVGHNIEREPPKDHPSQICPWVGPFQNCVRQIRPPFKIAAVA
jgi:hypothetical protein